MIFLGLTDVVALFVVIRSQRKQAVTEKMSICYLWDVYLLTRYIAIVSVACLKVEVASMHPKKPWVQRPSHDVAFGKRTNNKIINIAFMDDFFKTRSWFTSISVLMLTRTCVHCRLSPQAQSFAEFCLGS